MSTLNQLRRGLNNALHNIAEGWQQFSELATQALTRFNPIHRPEDSDKLPLQIEHNSSRWGLLAAEVHEDKKYIYINIEAPGMDAEDFDIQVIENTLVIRGEKRVQTEASEGHYHLMECAYGSFERAISLPAYVNEKSANASYKKGVLKVTLPKTSNSNNNKIEVK